MFGLIKKMLFVLLSNIVNGSNHTKYISISSQKCMIQTTLIHVHPNEQSQKFHYYPFAVKLDRCVRSCNTLNDLSNKVCIPKKTEVLNLSLFNMITEIDESKILTKHISCECKCKLDGRKCKSDQWWNNNTCRYECKKRENDSILNPATWSCENGKYLSSNMMIQRLRAMKL